jgi:hypothetical protein
MDNIYSPLGHSSWFKPVYGGIWILIYTHLAVVIYFFTGMFGMGISPLFSLPQYLILVIGGILSIAWGVVRRGERKRRSG